MLVLDLHLGGSLDFKMQIQECRNWINSRFSVFQDG